jgi:serine/threonine protein kinase
MGLRSELHAPRKSRKERQWDGNISTLRPLGHGVSGMVLAIDENRVVKIDIGSSRSIQDIETEREAYRNLSKGRSPYVLKCFEIDNPNGLVLERCPDTMRKRLRSMPSGFPGRDEIVKEWAYQAAKGLAFLHRHRIIQGDGQPEPHFSLSPTDSVISWLS